MREIHRQVELESLLASGESLHDAVIQGVDLTALSDQLLTRRWDGATLLGCVLTTDAEAHLRTTGALVFPRFDDLPYRPYRGALYTLDELEADELDLRIYNHQASYRGSAVHLPVLEALSQRIHDHAIDDALRAVLATHERVLAVMGGHAMHRDDAAYRTVATITRALTRDGFFVATGGGPGAMEAGNLGAWLATHDDDTLDRAVATLAEESDYSEPRFVELAQQVRADTTPGARSLAIPTWFYGHEPTNQFATDIAKYFSNSIREDGLLAIATHGVIYAPGAAGTVQEIFMDATQNHYGTFGLVSPMVFLGTEFWNETLPAVPLLRSLAGSRQYGDMVLVSDDASDIVDFVTSTPPVPYDG